MSSHAHQHGVEYTDSVEDKWAFVEHHAVGALGHRGVRDLRAGGAMASGVEGSAIAAGENKPFAELEPGLHFYTPSPTMNARSRLRSVLTCALVALLPAFSAKADDWATATGGNWSTGANWLDGTAPGSADSVSIAAAGAPYTVALDVNASITSLLLNSTDATLSVSSHTLTTTGAVSINAGLLVLTANGTTSTNTTLSAASGVTNHGTLRLTSGVGGPFSVVATIFGNVVNESAGTLEDGGKWFVPADFLLGKMLNKTTVASVEVSIPIIKDYDLYDFKVEARIGFFF